MKGPKLNLKSIDFKDLMIRKGERIGLGVGLVIMASWSWPAATVGDHREPDHRGQGDSGQGQGDREHHSDGGVTKKSQWTRTSSRKPDSSR